MNTIIFNNIEKFKILKFMKKICYLLIMILLLSSCISQKKVKILQSKELSAQFNNQMSSSYKIRSGDQLYIKVYSVDPKTSKLFQTDLPNLMNPTYLYLNSYTVDEEGYINFSFIDRLYVKGLTLNEARNLLQKTINEYFKEATVVLKLINFEVSVLGEVNNPGTFTIYNEQLTLLQAIGLAGGLKDFANIRKVKLIRQTVNGSEVYTLDLRDSKILESPYYYLQPDDVIYVEPLNSKSIAYDKFPYSVIISAITTILLGINIYLVNSK